MGFYEAAELFASSNTIVRINIVRLNRIEEKFGISTSCRTQV